MTSALFPLKLPPKPEKHSISHFFYGMEVELSSYKAWNLVGKESTTSRNGCDSDLIEASIISRYAAKRREVCT